MARELGEVLLVEADAAPVGDAAGVVGRVEVAAAVLADFDDGAVVLARDLGNEVVHALRPDLESGLGERPLGGHFNMNLRERVAGGCSAFVFGLGSGVAGWAGDAWLAGPVPEG